MIVEVLHIINKMKISLLYFHSTCILFPKHDSHCAIKAPKQQYPFLCRVVFFKEKKIFPFLKKKSQFHYSLFLKYFIRNPVETGVIFVPLFILTHS